MFPSCSGIDGWLVWLVNMWWRSQDWVKDGGHPRHMTYNCTWWDCLAIEADVPEEHEQDGADDDRLFGRI